jgi:hypothetical protein
MLSMCRPFFSTHSAYVDLFLAHNQHAYTYFKRTLSARRQFFSAHSAYVKIINRLISASVFIINKQKFQSFGLLLRYDL